MNQVLPRQWTSSPAPFHLLTFVLAYLVSSLFEPKRDLTGLTFWTQIASEEEGA